MVNSAEVNNLINKRKVIDENNPDIDNIWSSLTHILSQNEKDTIKYLNEGSEEQIYYLSEIFDDLSSHFKSQTFIDELERLETKYPNLDISSDIFYAKKYLNL